MKRLLILTLLSMPAAAAAQELNKTDLDSAPDPAAAAAALQAPETLQRPDAPALMSELSAALRLSSKQEDRISTAIKKKTTEFDKLMKEYDKNSVEEKRWLYKVNENRHGMVKINKEMPDLVREFLDDEQRQAYDKLLEAKRRPAVAPAEAAAVEAAPSPQDTAVKPVKKRRLVRRKKVKGAAAVPAAETAPAAAKAEAGDEAGQVMVDGDTVPNSQPATKKKRVLKKRQLAKDASSERNDISEDLAGSKPTGKESSSDDEDAGSYP